MDAVSWTEDMTLGQSLGHDVCQHRSCFAVLELDFTSLDLITDVMVLDVDMLRSTMVHRILRHLDTRLIVFDNDEVRSWLVGCRQNFA